MNINYDYYRIFYYVAKYGNFTQAANILLNNQPNITRSIKKLENELGCTLFVRSNRGATLTPEGEKLFAHVSVAVEQLRAGEEELSRDKSLQSGTVTVGVSETALHGLLLSVLNKFRSKYPGIRIRLSNHSTPQAMSALRNGRVDLAVVTTPTDVSNPLHEYRLTTFREILVCGKDFSHLQNKVLQLKDLTKYPLICLGKETKTNEFFSRFFMSHGLVFLPDMEAATTDQILPMVRNNLGLGFLPDIFAEPAIEMGAIYGLKLQEKIPRRDICLLKNTERPLSIAAKELEKMLLQEKTLLE